MKSNLLIIDNYDSFTYNIVAIAEKYAHVKVVRNDELEIEFVKNFDAILFSPGPGLPKNAGMMPAIISSFYSQIPMLGICLGHQAIGEFFGAKLEQADQFMHGKQCKVDIIKDTNLSVDINATFYVGRYHSWVLNENLSENLDLIMSTKDNVVMGIKHKKFPVYGLQFHPESVLTPEGEFLIRNFIAL